MKFFQTCLPLLILCLIVINGFGLAPYSLSMDSVYADEGVYACQLESYRQGLSPYFDFNSHYGPCEYLVMNGWVGSGPLRLVDIRMGAACLNGIAILALFLLGRRLFGKESPYAIIPALTQGILGPQLAGNVAYVDFTCLPFFCAWTFFLVQAVSSSPNRGGSALAGFCSAILCFIKPQYGLCCVGVCWSLAFASAPRLWRLWPLLVLLVLLSYSHRHPGLMIALASGWIWYHFGPDTSLRQLSRRGFILGFGGALTGLLVSAACHGLFLNVFYYPLAIVQSAAGVRSRMGDEAQWIPRSWQMGLMISLLCLSLRSRALVVQRCLLGTRILGCCLFAYSLVWPWIQALVAAYHWRAAFLLATPSLALLLAVWFWLCTVELARRQPATPTDWVVRCAAMVALAASYDLSYIHARVLSVVSLALLLQIRSRRTPWDWFGHGIMAVALAAGAGLANLPYYLDLRRCVEQFSAIPTEYCQLDVERAGIFVKRPAFEEYQRLRQRLERDGTLSREVIDAPGLAFLLGNYSPFQKDHPGYNYVFGSYPDPRVNSPQILIPSAMRQHPYTLEALKYRPLLDETEGFLILGPR